MTYREVLRKEKNRGQRKQLLYEDGLLSSRGRLGFYISKKGHRFGWGPHRFACFPHPCVINGPHATLYYKALYSILQSTTPVRLLFYKVLLQYDSAAIVLLGTRKTYSVLRRSKKVLLHTTKYYSSTYYKKPYSSTTLY